MLFVFGKRAKKLRLNKVSELIHKSDDYQALQYARVSVYFQDIVDTGEGDEDYRILPNSECIVTRVARKDNSSQYKLNGKGCAFKDVATFLDSKGIDLDNNRFLILQGEVEMISMMPPKGKTESDEGLLEYLEDIIGSNKYVADTNLAAQKVDAFTEQRQEKLNRVKAVEKEKDNLEGAKQEAEALLQKDREIRRQKNILYQLHQQKYIQDAKHISKNTEKANTNLEEAREGLTTATARVNEIDATVAQDRKAYQDVFAELQRTKEEFTAYERRDIKLREEIKHGKAQQKKAKAKVAKELQKEEAATTAGQEATAAIPVLEQQVEELTVEKATQDEALELIFDDMKGVTDELRVQLDQKSNELAPIHQERAGFQAELDTAKTQAQLSTDSVNRSKEQLKTAESELASLDSSQSTKRDELASTEDELMASKQTIVQLEEEDKELAKKEQILLQRNKELVVRRRRCS
jgi:structural maintenance of chromosome 4